MPTKGLARPSLSGFSTILEGDYNTLAHGVPFPVKHPASVLAQREQIVQEAASKYHINGALLWGVYGVEASHGSDVKTSSAGAKGSFQFIKRTAEAYGYPYTNATDTATFTKQAEAAAHYLSSLLPGGRGEAGLKAGKPWEAAWEKAFRAYSGGEYGLAKVKAHTFKKGTAAANQASETTNQAEKTKVESEEGLGLGGDILAGFEQFLAGFALTGVLLAAGAVLVVYGIMVAVRPRERAFSIPLPVV